MNEPAGPRRLWVARTNCPTCSPKALRIQQINQELHVQHSRRSPRVQDASAVLDT
jgi:hypothetical protein